MSLRHGTTLVTGGCGFIGSHLVRRLAAEGRHVVVLDDLSNGSVDALPAGVEFRRGDVGDGELARDLVGGVSVVFHLAAVAAVQRSNEQWLRSHLTNSLGPVAVMEALRDLAPGARFVYASSAAVYGETELGPGEAVSERVEPRPIAPYGIDKRSMELHAIAGGRLFGIASCGLRFFNVFGPGQSPDSPYSGVISKFLAQAARGGPLTIFGDGLQTRDFVHVDDVVEALLAGERTASAAAPIVNICSGRATTLRDLAASIARLVDPSVETVYEPARPGDIRHSLGDPSLAARLLDWRPRVELEPGLARMGGDERRASRLAG